MTARVAQPLDSLSTHGLPMSRNDTPSSGFTAVNGDGQRNVYQPKEDTIKKSPPIREYEPGQKPFPITQGTTEQYHTHGWRAEYQSPFQPQPESFETKKRKRSESVSNEQSKDAQTDQPQANGSESPKRRMTNIDSAIDVSSPGKGSQVPASFKVSEPRVTDSMPLGVYSRERSPVLRADRGEPPPPPRPDIEANLAASLQRELHGAQQAQAQAQAQQQARARAPAFAPSQKQTSVRGSLESSSPTSETYYQQQSYSPEPHDWDPLGKKRKRTFSNRTKTGCHTCRGRKKKCDEHKPICLNCERGGFHCGGYGPKPPGFKAPGSGTRAPIVLQAKGAYEPSHGPTGYYHMPSPPLPPAPTPTTSDGPSYSHWGRIPSESEQGPPIAWRGSWAKPSGPWPAAPPPSVPPYAPERVPSHEYPQLQPMPSYQSGPLPPPPPPPPQHPHQQQQQQPLPRPPPPPPPPPPDTWGSDHQSMTPYRHSTGPGAVMSSKHSNTSSSSLSQAAHSLSYNPRAELTERQKMLLGRPFLPWVDSKLLNDRQECKGALERYNDAARSTSHVSHEERGRFFRAIVEPPARPEYKTVPRDIPYEGPKGKVGQYTIVESPFTCDYGYNIHLGNEVLIQFGCYMQDACEISIGDRTVVGPNVKFYTVNASIDAQARKGSRGPVTAGAIRIGEDCLIGGDVIILPFRTIGQGAVVGAGSVVTKNVDPYTVVAGNPAVVRRRIEPGQPNIERHKPEIQQQNDRMLNEMWEAAKLQDR